MRYSIDWLKHHYVTFATIEWWIRWCRAAEGQGQVIEILHGFRETLHFLHSNSLTFW